MRADAANAASVVVTHDSATGAVRVDQNGSPVVDITICASFDQPVVYIDAAVTFDPEPDNTPGAIAFGPRSGAVKHWCGTIVGIAAPTPGSYTINVTWSAHNGNALSMGHAHGG